MIKSKHKNIIMLGFPGILTVLNSYRLDLNENLKSKAFDSLTSIGMFVSVIGLTLIAKIAIREARIETKRKNAELN